MTVLGGAVEWQARLAIEDMLRAIASTIDDDRLEAFPEFFTQDGVYKVVSRFNLERNLPFAQINCAGKGMIIDRITSIRNANLFRGHRYRHFITGTVCTREGDARVTARSNCQIIRTIDHGEPILFASCEYRDVVEMENSTPLLSERIVVLDSKGVETALVLPI
jgi:anthranilate 1,2-dioxygenase small subunit